MRPSLESKKLLRQTAGEIIADEGKSTALVHVGPGRPPGVKKEKPRDTFEQEGFEFYLNLGDKRTLDQVAKKVKVPLVLVETWRKEYHWDAKLELRHAMASIQVSAQKASLIVDLFLDEMTMEAPPQTQNAAVPKPIRLVDMGNKIAIAKQRILNPIHAGTKKLSDLTAILKDLKALAFEKYDKYIALIEEKAKTEDESGKGPKNAIQVNVTILK